MIKILFTLYWGHLKRYRWQFFIILSGLMLGLTTGVLSFLYISYDLTYDHHYPEYEDIYRLYREEVAETGSSVIYSAVPIFLGNQLKEQFPEIQTLSHITPYNKVDLRIQNTTSNDIIEERVSGIIAVDTNYLRVFPQEFLHGSKESSLLDPHSLVVTQQFVLKYFGIEDPVGEMVNLNGTDFTIRGVIKNLPGNTHIKFDVISSSLIIGMPFAYFFLKMQPHANMDQFISKLESFFKENPSARSLSSAVSVKPVIIPLKDIHWANQTIDTFRTEHKYYVWAISLIGIFVILVCLFNFATVLSAQGALRGKELGIKRVLGENKAGLYKSLFFETFLTVGIGIILSLLLIEMILPLFNSFIDKNITESHLYSPRGILFIIGTWIFISISSGILPAFQYSRISVSETVKGMNEKPSKFSYTQIALLMFQFVISFVVILVTVFIAGQVKMTRVMDLGFNKDNVIMLNNPDLGYEDHFDAIRTELLKNPDIIGVTTALNFPKRGAIREDILVETPQGPQNIFTGKMWVGDDYLNVMGMTLLKGNTLTPAFPDGVLVNETFVRKLGLDDALEIEVLNNQGENFGKIIGVVKDFNLYSLHDEIIPIALISQGGYESGRIHIRFEGRKLIPILSHIEKVWNDFYTEDPFSYYFLDEDLAAYYQEDRIHSVFLWIASAIAFILGILGLFAMTSFDIQQKKKALAIQRVFGANFIDLLKDLSKLKIILLSIAFVFAILISVSLYSVWVQNFAYRAPVNIPAIVVVFFMVTITYLLTVMNLVRIINNKAPIDSLRID
ncbi:MAG: FtsX-like permease family protein [Bacteroidetes bacterium]|nr:FtsX-like permease family protein [Bacteroidota bacterium]MBT4399666.1 FtsX-like permease family protein [Bacteroidota bacterium]